MRLLLGGPPVRVRPELGPPAHRPLDNGLGGTGQAAPMCAVQWHELAPRQERVHRVGVAPGACVGGVARYGSWLRSHPGLAPWIERRCVRHSARGNPRCKVEQTNRGVIAIIDTELGEADDTGSEGFPPAERKVVTQSYDLSIQTLAERWTAEELVLPEIQREYVWDNPRASRLVESLLLNIPIPVLYFAETEEGRWEIFDGQQRILSVVRYINNEFRLSGLLVLAELNGKRFHQLPDREKRFLKSRMMRAVVIAIDSHPNMKFEIFERLNTGAVVLNAQELRNSLYRGTFNALLRELVKDSQYRTAIGTASPRKRMVDEEFALRFFALSAGLGNYRPPLKKFLNEYMRGVQDASPKQIGALRARFDATVAPIVAVWGANAYRQTNARGSATERTPNRALFDAQMVAFDLVTNKDTLVSRRSELVKEFAKLYRDEDFVDAISLATGDKSRTYLRIRYAVGALRRAGLDVPKLAFLD